MGNDELNNYLERWPEVTPEEMEAAREEIAERYDELAYKNGVCDG